MDSEGEVFQMLAEFAALKNEADVAYFFDIDVRRLRYFAYMQSSKYKTFTIVKASGKARVISAPNSFLKVVQRRLSDTLYQIYQPRQCVKGFTLNEGIVSNAKVHIKKRFVLNIDLLDFFNSINFGRVRGLFLSAPFSFNHEVATLLAQLCCFQGKTPQGAPTSPVISNMICFRLDKELMSFAKQRNLFYTRYADDITFSTKTNSFPEDVAFQNDGGGIQLSDELLNIFSSNGFEVNDDKLRLSAKYNRQEVTGLIVNKFVNVKRDYVRNLRAMIHCWQTKGYEEASKRFYSKYDHRGVNKLVRADAFKLVVDGKLRFLRDVRGEDNKIYLNLLASAKKASPDDFRVPLSELEKLAQTFEELKNMKYNGKKIKVAERGVLLENVLTQLFRIFEVPVKSAFRRNGKGEQIDGAFKYDGRHFLFECKWREKKSDHNDFDSLNGKVRRSGKMVLGFFLAINGYSSESIESLKRDTEKTIIAMDGDDLDGVLKQKYTLSEMLSFKIDNFAFNAEPYVSYRRGDSFN